MAMVLQEELRQVFEVIEARSSANDLNLVVHLTKATKILKEMAQDESTKLHCDDEQGSRLYKLLESHTNLLLSLLLCLDDPYVVHCARKTLLGISDYLLPYKTWRTYIQLLWTASRSPTTDVLLLFRDIFKLCHERRRPSATEVLVECLGCNMSLLITDHPSGLYWGAFLRLLITSVRILQRQEETVLSLSFLARLKDVLPSVAKNFSREDFTSARYAKYKSLVLLLKLSDFGDPEVSLCSLTLLSTAEPGLLQPSLRTSPKLTQSSPFQNSDDASPELQRRAILILLKSVVTTKKTASEDVNKLAEKVFLDWLAGQDETHGAMDDLLLSLVHLYVDEDDMLLNLLVTFMDFQSDWYKTNHYQAFFCSICPRRVFHLFLAGICYDHTVLIDLLISETSGVSCIHYLLRCLRMIGDDWAEFLLLPREMNTYSLETRKRKRVDELPLVHEVSSERAKLCLVHLHDSIQRLHARNLFPYNAGPLLQRLAGCSKL
ncbi:uncharacterized protein LOC112351421 isoform X1 [Selaginella moellendorffii]|uniref:uncharacterized protein LOC112351421 isoform X1 n=1 Tax=Selaginella moellendorffii TaxID=88036 RepID=UPI000D1C427F|nr:uncharacterized protein LOC112351421 isoform X1 [Selaginella moellendorffii]|eukprot:XP_024545085.1 uncharacterized protein LOC112351421 isoform X1 [Selaginella moellendorffii]